MQQRIYDAFVANDSLSLTVPNRCGATSVLAGLAVAQVMCGKRVLVVCSTKGEYSFMSWHLRSYLLNDPLYTSSLTDRGFVAHSASGGFIECVSFNPLHLHLYALHLVDCILIDHSHSASCDLFYKLVVPAMQQRPVRFLAIGRAPGPESSLAHALTLVPDEFVRKIRLVPGDEAPHWALWLNKAKARRLKQLHNGNTGL